MVGWEWERGEGFAKQQEERGEKGKEGGVDAALTFRERKKKRPLEKGGRVDR